jgi:putative DNA primase/helicase
LRRSEDYSPEQGARFEVHFEKLRNRVEGDGALPFEAKLVATSTDETGVRWLDCDLRPPTQLFKDGLSVREVAATLRVDKTEAGRLRLRAVSDGLLVSGTGALLPRNVNSRVRAMGS